MKTHILTIAFILFISIAFSQTEILNNGFEDFKTVPREEFTDTIIDDWHSNQTTAIYSLIGTSLTEDSYEGKYAIKLWNWYYYGKGTLINGEYNDRPADGTPISFSPHFLSGNYKYYYGENAGNKDSAIAEVIISKYNTLKHKRDTIGYGIKYFGPTNTYTHFKVDLDYKSTETPDTMTVKLVSSKKGFCDTEKSNGTCLYFYVDNLAIGTVTGIDNPTALNKDLYTVLYDGESKSIIIKSNSTKSFRGRIELYNSVGQLSYSTKNINESITKLPISFPPGIYTCILQEEEILLSNQKIVVR